MLRHRVLLTAGALAAVGLAPALLTASAGATSSKPPAATFCLALVPAAYGNSVWTGISAPHAPPAQVIANEGGTTDNPSSGGGPGGAYSSFAAKQINGARANKVTILGYVWTNVANTDPSGPPASISEIEAQIQAWKKWYGVTDIFFDGASSSGAASQVSFYATIYKYVHTLSPGSIVWINPGDYPAQAYMATADVVLDWEETKPPTGAPPKWVLNYPASRFANFVHSYSGSVAAALTDIRNDHAGYAYVTSNNYGSLPSYWSTEQADACA